MALRITAAKYRALAGKSIKDKSKVPIAGAYRSNWSGKRCVGGKECFFRSLYEYNYACFLEWEKQRNMISDWLFEPKTFDFPKDAYKASPFSYMPDYQVFALDQTYRWHEVKGWLNPASKKKIKRFNKHHGGAEGEIILIDGDWFKSAFKNGLHRIVPGWKSLEEIRNETGK